VATNEKKVILDKSTTAVKEKFFIIETKFYCVALFCPIDKVDFKTSSIGTEESI